MGYPREAVAKLLIPAFLPFNLLKGGLNAALSMMLYKPLVNVLRKSELMPANEGTHTGRSKVNMISILVSSFVIVTCILLILVLQGRL